ncbi:hypothetical protein KUTeg_006469 [Tegillarca granosa]|uniref:Uncharacterized protein n=1 Tax=Tegillarca granosa TaxID=220873 RepID=A0ABQ9FL91_TEGGR|nr:hypothetical protein KUTeg_006469 [Tegillarca granosa]
MLISNGTSKVTWLKNGHSFVNTQDLTTEVVYIGSEVTTKLTFYAKNSGYNDSGTYTCTDGNSSKSVRVTVIKDPYLNSLCQHLRYIVKYYGKVKIGPLKDRIVTFVNDTISLLCEYEGNVKLESFWMKDDVIPIESVGFSINRRSFVGKKIITTSEVTKRDLTSHDAGEYFCHAGPFVKKVTLEVYPGKENSDNFIDLMFCIDMCIRSQNKVVLNVARDHAPCLPPYCYPKRFVFHAGLCNSSLMSGPLGVADDHITASMTYRAERDLIRSGKTKQADGLPGQNRFYGGAWAPRHHDNKQWLQFMVKLQKLSVVKQIITQGRSSTDCCSQEDWVKKFKLSYSQDNVTWFKYKDFSGSSMVFSANYDHNSYRVNQLPVPVIAQYIQINPVSWNQRIAMRLDIIGCFIPSDIRIIEPKRSRLSLEIPSSLHLSCQFVGPDMPSITWYKDGRDISKSNEFIRRSVTSENDGQISVVLSIRKALTHYSDSGHYTCQETTTKLNKTVIVHIGKFSGFPSKQPTSQKPIMKQYKLMIEMPKYFRCSIHE